MVFQHFQHFQHAYVSEIANIRTLNPAENAENVENAENNYFFHTEFQQLAEAQVLSVNDIEQGALGVQLLKHSI